MEWIGGSSLLGPIIEICLALGIADLANGPFIISIVLPGLNDNPAICMKVAA